MVIDDDSSLEGVCVEIVFLGTASAEGYPAAFCDCYRCRRARLLGGKNIRARASIVVDGTVLVDIPPDVYTQSLKCGVKLGDIRLLLITHSHPDHLYIPELRLRKEPFTRSRLKMLYVVADRLVARRVRRGLRGELRRSKIRVVGIDPGDTVSIADYRVVAVPAVHNVSGRERPLNYIIEKDGRSFLYAVDTGPYTHEALRVLEGLRLDLVVADATMGLRSSRDFRYHMGFEDVKVLREWMLYKNVVNEDTPFVLTHFSHNYSPPHDELARELERYGFVAAYDCMRLPI